MSQEKFASHFCVKKLGSLVGQELDQALVAEHAVAHAQVPPFGAHIVGERDHVLPEHPAEEVRRVVQVEHLGGPLQHGDLLLLAVHGHKVGLELHGLFFKVPEGRYS